MSSALPCWDHHWGLVILCTTLTTHSLALGLLHSSHHMEPRLVSQVWTHVGFQCVPRGHQDQAIMSPTLCLDLS